MATLTQQGPQIRHEIAVCVIGNHDIVAARPADGSAPAADPRREFGDQRGAVPGPQAAPPTPAAPQVPQSQ